MSMPHFFITLIFATLTAATLAALAWSGVELLRGREDPLAARLEELQAHAMTTSARRSVRRRGGFINSFLYLLSLVPGGEGYLRETEEQLVQGGLRQRWAVGAYALFQLVFLLTLCGAMAYFQRGNDGVTVLVGMGAAVLLGWLLPRQVLYFAMRRYRRKLADALPDTVDLLGVVLGTGLALDQAMLRVSEEMEFIYPELAAEFATVVMQVKAGQERAKAFRQLVRRTGIEDIKALAAMIVQSERFGTSLSQALKVYADSLRSRRRLRAETAVAKAGIKMLIPIVLFILPALFVVTLVPGVITVLHNLSGGFGPPR
jgi:tight adherence protein C